VTEPRRVDELQNYFITKIGANTHSVAVTDNGELFLWGSGAFG